MEVRIIGESRERLPAFKEFQTAYMLDNGVETWEYILPESKAAAFVEAGGKVVEVTGSSRC